MNWAGHWRVKEWEASPLAGWKVEENAALWYFNSCVESRAMSTFSQEKWSLQVEKSILKNICTYFFFKKAIHKHCYFSRIGLLLPSWLPSWLHSVTVNSYLWNFVRNHFRNIVSLSFPAIDSNKPDSCCILDKEKGLAEVICICYGLYSCSSGWPPHCWLLVG